MIKRKTLLKKLTVSVAVERKYLNCHDSVLSAAFPERNNDKMDADQQTPFLLTHQYNTFDESTANVAVMMSL